MADIELNKRGMNVALEIEKELNESDESSSLSNYVVKLDAFEGPFDLLLHMIDEGKVDIYTISVTQIITGYLAYLKVMKELDIAIASEFLLMAAYLIEMKSRMLLPVEVRPEEAQDMEEIEKTLLERLHEYKVFKGLAEQLKGRKEEFGRAYSRYTADEPVMEEERDVFLSDVTLRDLVSAFQRIWKKVEEKGEVHEIANDNITLPEKIEEIKQKLIGKPDGLPFEELFGRMVKIEIVVTFLAVLELARQHLIQIRQGEIFGSILIFGRFGNERS